MSLTSRNRLRLGRRRGRASGNPFRLPGVSLHRELELLVRAGLSPGQALATATTAPAHALGRHDAGAIAEDRVADIVLLEGNPLQDIANVRRVAQVVLRGAVVLP